MKLWDYKIPKNWQPKTCDGWLKIDEGKRLMLKFYFEKYGIK